MKVIHEKHPLAMRWTHWVNFPILLVMIWSGMLIYWANDAIKLRYLGIPLFISFQTGSISCCISRPGWQKEWPSISCLCGFLP